MTEDKRGKSKPADAEGASGDDAGLERIGPYRILDVLGEGGMAIVYLAEQSEPVRRRVALKILKAGMDSKQVVARFESERQALAVLDHPNIAKVFDGGIAAHGRPYFAMERVHGIPINDYCDEHRLGTDDRVRLFVDVCNAVQHAHMKGLIHRDLKPSNILVGVVDGKPQPKIIDFGIAKATSASLGEETPYTKIGQIIGTPQYMSPEQANVTGLDVDTRTDVYSLGVVLYELLVGTLPIDLSSISQRAMQFAILEKDPQKPSTRVTQLGDTKDEIARARKTDPGQLSRQLKGDLDWIVMRAIEKDRTRRYETVNALAMECRRHLNHEPVLARPPSPGYLLSRFVRRNRTAVLAGSFAFVALLAGAAAATIGFVRATEAERAALLEAETARQASDFMIELFRVSDPSEARGNTITAREILDRGAARIRTNLSSEPAVQAALMNTMGNVYTNLGLYEQAQPLLDDALQGNDEVHGRESEDTADNLFDLGELARLRGDYGRAESLHREVLSLRESLHGQRHLKIGDSLHGLGLALYFLGEYEESGEILRRALEMYREFLGENDPRVADAYSSLGSLMHNTDRYDEAERFLRRSLAIHRTLYGDVHPNVASNLNDLGLVLEESDRLDEAEDAYTEAIDVFRKVYPGDHPFTAETMMHLAGLARFQGDAKRSEALFRESIAMLERTVGKEHMLTVRATDSFGVMLLSTGRYEEAEPIMVESMQLHKLLLGERHINTARAINNMGALLFLKGDYARAEPYFRESLSIRAERLGAENADVANSKNNLADLLNRLDRFAEAAPLAAEAAAAYEAVFSESHWRAAVARNINGRSLAGLGRFEEAEPLILESDAIIEDARNGSVYHRMALQRTVELYDAWNKPAEAMRYQALLDCEQDASGC